MAGRDVVVHFDTKEAADKFEASVTENDGVCIPGEYPDSADYIEATYVETLECIPRD